ncbi:hypothetical protein HYE67_007579 [Fusarium culmorum]|uniref:PUM-HD domain-containing protein n=2 Tax=Fusarium culmorum TaxID=5516 RepID=A0A7S8HXX7_FUSCU|nr:hypothetical protein HYE67_007579 [Fusarium culmorum]
MSAASQPPPSNLPYGGGSDTTSIWATNHNSLPSRDNVDRSNDLFNTRNASNNTGIWHTSSNSQSHSSSPNNRTNGTDELRHLTHPFSQMGIPDSSTSTGYTRFNGTGNSEDMMNSTGFGYAAGSAGSVSRPELSFGVSHNTSSSIHSQSGMRYQQSLMSQQTYNQHAFSLNNAQGLDNQPLLSSVGRTPLNPASQAWNQNITNHASSSSLGGNSANILALYPTTSRMDQGNSYNDFLSPLGSRESISRPLENESERRMPSQHQYPPYHPRPNTTALQTAYLNAGLSMPSSNAPMQFFYQQSNFVNSGVNAHGNHNQSASTVDPWCRDFIASLKSDKKQHLTLDMVFGHVVLACGTQDISRFIQNKLQQAKSEDKQRMFDEIGSDMINLMKDLYGNYVCQKLIENGSMAQKMHVIQAVKGHIVQLSLNVYGCRVFQKIVDCCPPSHIVGILDEIHSYDVIKSLSQDECGNHVIQKLVQTMPPKDVKFITVACQEHARELSANSFSCRILQRVLEYAEEDDRKKLVESLILMMDKLVTDQWGNYVAGHIIEHRGPEDRDRFFEHVMTRLFELCHHKLGSHVVEKCIKFGTPEQRTQIRKQLSPDDDTEDRLENTLKDQFGNYVVASLLKHLEWGSQERIQLKRAILTCVDSIKATSPNRTFPALDKVLVEDKRREAIESRLQVEVDSAAPTPALTNETNSPQSDSLPSADTSAIEVHPTDGKNTEANPRVRDDDAWALANGQR